jgi:hypothetical protein
MFDDIFKVFSAWEPLAKARKAKGLGNWEKLAKLSDKLTGKTSKDIVFTCGHPSHGTNLRVRRWNFALSDGVW